MTETATATETVTRTESRPTEERAQEGLEKAEALGRRAADMARTAAEKLPAGVVVVVGAGALLALDAFGVGEVLTAGCVAYGAYRLLRRRARRRVAEDEAAR